MAKKKSRKGGRHKGRLTKKEIAKAGGIPQAWAARKHGKAGRKTARKAHRSAKQKAAAKRNLRKARAAQHRKSPRKAARKATRRSKARKGGKRRSRKSSRRAHRGASRSSTKVIKSTVVRHLPGHTSAIVVSPIGSSGRGKRRRSGGGKRRKGRKGTRRHGRKGKSRRGRKARESYAMENPLSAMELALGLFTGALGFGLADFTDRFLATHALGASATVAGANGDTPPTTGDYKGLFNATAVLAPMNLPRWGAGVALAAVPFVAAAFVRAPAGRSALQMFGFGAAMRTLGKGMTDLVAKLGPSTTIVQRLYDGETRANALQVENQGGTPPVASASLPSSGLGKATTCTGCGKTGVGSCCTSCASKRPAANAPPPPPPPAAVPAMAPNLPSPTNLVPGAFSPAAPAVSLQGVPAPRKSRYDWGYKGDDNGGE